MSSTVIVSIFALAISYIILQAILHGTQSTEEPRLLESKIPFLDPALGILRNRANYFAKLRTKYKVSIHTLRMPFQRLYIVHDPHMIQMIQKKSNAATFVPNLLDFGMLFSGLNPKSQSVLRKGFGSQGNGFTMSVHKYLLSGPSLQVATREAVNRLSASLPKSFGASRQGGLLEFLRHELTIALTGAIYGPENPYDDAEVEKSWQDFIPGINHLLYSPMPWLTAGKSLKARTYVIEAFRRYFERGGHTAAFPMIPEMYEMNKSHGLSSDEAANMEMATSLAMLSSGANTAFWLVLQIFSDPDALRTIRGELLAIAKEAHLKSPNTLQIKTVSLDRLRDTCPTLVAMLNETFRYHSTVINIKQVQHDTMLDDQYLLKKNGIVMIPGQSVHHNMDIWGPNADTFDHTRFLSSKSKHNLGNTSAFRPFGAGTSMCPGRHFSTNVILSLVAMVVLQYDVVPLGGRWIVPTKRNADLWNAMPKPDRDASVEFLKRSNEECSEWRFSWGEDN